MPRLPVLRPKDLLKILQRAGFVVDHITGSHYILCHSEKHSRVVLPFHLRDLPKGTLLSILRSAGLSKKDIQK